jgi:hypothetical protein
VTDDALGRSKTIPLQTPQAFSSVADRFAADAARRADLLMINAEPLDLAEQRQNQARSHERFSELIKDESLVKNESRMKEYLRLSKYNDVIANTGGAHASYRHYDEALNLYSAATAADPSSVTYAKGKAAALVQGGNLRGALAATKTMQELAVMPRLHPRARIA